MRDVQRVRDDLNISFPLVFGPVFDVADAYGVWHYQRNAAFGTVIVDRNGVVRMHHVSRDEFDRPGASKLLDVLRSID